MPEENAYGERKQFIVRLTGLKPEASRDDVVAGLQRLYPRKPVEEIREALDQLPLLLSRTAPEDQAGKLKHFLESIGGIVQMTLASQSSKVAPASPGGEGPLKPAKKAPPSPPPSATTSSAPGTPGIGERRSKPRVHSGIQLNPMGIGEILDRSFRLLRQNFWLLFFIIFIPQAVFFVVNTVLRLILTGGLTQGPASMAMGVGFGISAFISGVIFMIFQFWSQGALIHAVSENYLGHSTSVKAAYGALRGRLWRLIGTLILVIILIMFFPAFAGIASAIVIPLSIKAGVDKLIMALVGGVAFVLVVWAFFHFLLNCLMVDKVVVIEDIGWLKALRRSKALMKVRTEPGFWKGPKIKAVLILLLGFLIAIGIQLVIQIPGALLSIFMKGSFVALTINGILEMVANSLATVFTATAVILYYYDIRVRHEGFDLKMMAENL